MTNMNELRGETIVICFSSPDSFINICRCKYFIYAHNSAPLLFHTSLKDIVKPVFSCCSLPLWGWQRPLLFLVFSLHLLPVLLDGGVASGASLSQIFAAFTSTSLQPCRLRSVRSVRSVRSASAAAAWRKFTVSWILPKPKTRRLCSLSISRYLWFLVCREKNVCVLIVFACSA